MVTWTLILLLRLDGPSGGQRLLSFHDLGSMQACQALKAQINKDFQIENGRCYPVPHGLSIPSRPRRILVVS